MSTSPLSLLTRAESSGYIDTSRHADVMRFVEQLGLLNDPRLFITDFGESQEGRALPLLVLSTAGVKTPDEARAAGRPVVLVLNGIHAGEVEGKEASLMLTRDLLQGSLGDVLEHVTLVIVPLFNPDGNDRISTDNRKLDIAKLEGQLGPPGGVGTRVNASGINLNRDYMRQKGVEMRLLQRRVCQPWQPHLTVDCHATNGSIHRFALTYDIPHTIESGRREPILYMRERLLPVVTRRLKARTGIDTFYYGNFVADEGGVGRGWVTYPHHPRFGSNYRGLTGRLDLLLETYAYISFEERVRTTYEFLAETLRYVAEHGSEVVEVVEASRRPPERVSVRYRLEAFSEPVEILTRAPYTLAGEPVSVTVPHLARFVGTEIVERPFAYAVPANVAEHLQQHGLTIEQLPSERHAVVEVARVEVDSAVAKGSGEPRQILEAAAEDERTFEAHYARETRALPAGTWLVPTDQPLGAIAVYLCEAASDDGLVAAGLLPALQHGAEFPVLRVMEPIRR